MKKIKKTLNIIASIFSLVAGAYLSLVSSVLILKTIEEETQITDPRLLNILTLFKGFGIELFSLAIALVFGAILLLVASIKNWKSTNTLVFQISLIVLSIVLMIYHGIRLKQIIWILIYLVSIVLIIISMLLKSKTNNNSKIENDC
ncbi:MAG: hypothetical protein J1F32_05035 [Erysipelotrichales bacterium]|nr:hypothetical protein [Erysipelotrichales bacterium]